MTHPARKLLPTVLLTGFDAFAGAALNPSWLAVKALHGRVMEGHRLVAAQLPTQFGVSLQHLYELLERHEPAQVICVGQSSRAVISIERVALNMDDARIADNAGQSPLDQAVVPGGPSAYFSTLPIKAMYAELVASKLAAEVSLSAGSFVCNHVFYGLMHHLATQPTTPSRPFPARGGFIHVPSLPEQLRQGQQGPSMPLEQIIQGLQVAIQASLKHPQDVAVSAGRTD